MPQAFGSFQGQVGGGPKLVLAVAVAGGGGRSCVREVGGGESAGNDEGEGESADEILHGGDPFLVHL